MSLQGSLRSLSIPDLLSLLHQHKKTGLLSLVSRQDERSILLNRGNLVYATASDSSKRLGSFLVRLGVLSESQLSTSARSRGGPEPAFLGQELIARGMIQSGDLQEAVREQILDILDEALLWEEGAFHFDEREDGSSTPTGAVIPTQSILLDAIRRFDESQLIRRNFPDLSVVLQAPLGAPAPVEADSPQVKAALDLVDGKRTVREVLRASDHSPYETSQVLIALSNEGRLQAIRSAPPPGLLSLPEPWALPVAPDLPSRINWIFRQRDRQLSQLAEVVSREPTLAAKALRQFTAARLELPSEELCISRIVGGLGELRARALVVPELIRGMFFSEKEFFWKDCREHSLLCAHLCHDLASRVEYPYPEEAYLAGLLHKLGVFILIGVHPRRYRAVLDVARRTRRDLRILEEMEFGVSHLEVGEHYASAWRYPEHIVQAIRLHGRLGEGEAGPLVDLVAVANWIARMLEVGSEFSSNTGNQITGALARLKLKKKNVLAISENTARLALAIQ